VLEKGGDSRRSRIERTEGFTLVEVVVVSVIVAALALVVVQLYGAYVTDARHNAAENLAASAAGYLMSAANAEQGVTDTLGDLFGNGEWRVTLPGGFETVFKCPARATVVIDRTDMTVTASVHGVESAAYSFDRN
jgi:prepilin-type N-terminal cleavage/methylation domain-containing protein